MSDARTLGERLALARNAVKMTQGELGKLVRMSQQSIADIENGKSKTTGKIGSLAHHTGVRALWLETGAGPMRDPQSDGVADDHGHYQAAIGDRYFAAQLVKAALQLSEKKRKALLDLLAGDP